MENSLWASAVSVCSFVKSSCWGKTHTLQHPFLARLNDNLLSHIFVCSAIEELKYHAFPSLSSSSNWYGMQWTAHSSIRFFVLACPVEDIKADSLVQVIPMGTKVFEHSAVIVTKDNVRHGPIDPKNFVYHILLTIHQHTNLLCHWNEVHTTVCVTVSSSESKKVAMQQWCHMAEQRSVHCVSDAGWIEYGSCGFHYPTHTHITLLVCVCSLTSSFATWWPGQQTTNQGGGRTGKSDIHSVFFSAIVGPPSPPLLPYMVI